VKEDISGKPDVFRAAWTRQEIQKMNRKHRIHERPGIGWNEVVPTLTEKPFSFKPVYSGGGRLHQRPDVLIRAKYI
jgi:hypothetical protein